MTIYLNDYQIVVTLNNKILYLLPMQESHKLVLPSQAVVTVIDVKTKKPAPGLVVSRQGQKLVIETSSKEPLTEWVDFYQGGAKLDQAATLPDLPTADATGTSAGGVACAAPAEGQKSMMEMASANATQQGASAFTSNNMLAVGLGGLILGGLAGGSSPGTPAAGFIRPTLPSAPNMHAPS